jgi:hypothetical protein
MFQEMSQTGNFMWVRKEAYKQTIEAHMKENQIKFTNMNVQSSTSLSNGKAKINKAYSNTKLIYCTFSNFGSETSMACN